MTSERLAKILELAGKIAHVASGKGDAITLENVFDHPEVVALREGLLELLGAADTATAMIEATAALHVEAERLWLAGGGKLDFEAFNKMQAITAAQRALSIQAFLAAGTPLQMFVYTLRQILPALQALVKAGVMVVAAVV